MLVPTIWQPFVRIPGSTMTLPLHCVASNVDLQVRNTYLQLARAELVVTDPSGSVKAERYPFDPQKPPHESEVRLNLSQSYQRAAIDYLTKHAKEGANALVVVEFVRVPRIDLDAIRVRSSEQQIADTCKNEDFDGERLRSILSANNAELMRYRRPQDGIGDGILRVNDVIGSIVLAGMVVISCWLLWWVMAGFVPAYITHENSLTLILVRRRADASEQGLTVTDAEIVKNRFYQLERRFMFWRVVGPALGFILTISSLVEGLHPSKQGSQDSFLLISALQLALVATFVGLGIRILAELAIRLHRTAAERQLIYLETRGRVTNAS